MFLLVFSILSRRCPLLATFLSVLFCLLSLLTSDSRFDLVWFRLSCDHGWIRSGSVNVRKTTNNNNNIQSIVLATEDTRFDLGTVKRYMLKGEQVECYCYIILQALDSTKDITLYRIETNFSGLKTSQMFTAKRQHFTGSLLFHAETSPPTST